MARSSLLELLHHSHFIVVGGGGGGGGVIVVVIVVVVIVVVNYKGYARDFCRGECYLHVFMFRGDRCKLNLPEFNLVVAALWPCLVGFDKTALVKQN